MKIQRHFVNKRGNKSYYKFVIVVPPEIITKANFKPGDELEADAKKGEIKLRRK